MMGVFVPVSPGKVLATQRMNSLAIGTGMERVALFEWKPNSTLL